MKVVALISGGKDSCFNMMQCIAAGHSIVALANIQPHSNTEIDSYMYQSVGHEAIEFIAKAMEVPLFREVTFGNALVQNKTYHESEGDEVEDLYRLLDTVKSTMGVEAVSVGAILSDYQRVRVENVCLRLDLVPLAYLWQRDQKELLNEMIKCEIDAIVVKVAALGLDTKHLGRSLSSIQHHLHSMSDKFGLNVCGEGGEYETLTLNCPLFKSRLVIDESEEVRLLNDDIAPVAFLNLKKIHLERKPPFVISDYLKELPLRDSDGYITDYGADACDLSDEDLDDESVSNLSVKTTYPSKVPSQNPRSICLSTGWLWIGGIQGNGGTISEAMADATYKLKSLLAENHHTVQDVCSLNMYIADMGKYIEVNKAYCEAFNHVNPPTRACVEVPSDVPVLLTAISWKPSDKLGDSSLERHTMHVRSRSHWAPSNIGPYSQAVRIGDFIYLAAQIGLIPGNLEVVQGGIKSQCQLALRHISRLFKAVDSNINLRDVVQGICYVTDLSYVKHAKRIWEAKTRNAIVDCVVVGQLPRGALVEWQVWAHKHNSQFEYEETGKSFSDFSVSIYRRWNYENDLAALVCYIDNLNEVDLNTEIFTEILNYIYKKLNQNLEIVENSVYNFTIFYSKTKTTCWDQNLKVLDENERLVYTLVPVEHIKDSSTYISICGIRSQ